MALSFMCSAEPHQQLDFRGDRDPSAWLPPEPKRAYSSAGQTLRDDGILGALQRPVAQFAKVSDTATGFVGATFIIQCQRLGQVAFCLAKLLGHFSCKCWACRHRRHLPCRELCATLLFAKGFSPPAGHLAQLKAPCSGGNGTGNYLALTLYPHTSYH